ncbi:MAG: hypothetical protein ACI3XJ_12675 [Oscillospiraceae bacterium]
MMCLNRALPDYDMNAGEARTLTIPIYNSADKQIDMTDMAARFAISDPINQDSEPFVIKACSIVTSADSDCAVLRVELDAADTINMCGQYIYQVTIKDADGRQGVIKGVLTIAANYDKAAISV